MTQTNTVTVHILDKEYCIACPDAERANLESAASYLDGKMRDIRSGGKVIGSDRIAVMAGLNITHELLHKHERQEQQGSVARDQIRDLLDRVNDALSTDSDPDLFSPQKT